MRRIRVFFLDENNDGQHLASSIQAIVPSGLEGRDAVEWLKGYICEEVCGYAADECIALSKDIE